MLKVVHKVVVKLDLGHTFSIDLSHPLLKFGGHMFSLDMSKMHQTCAHLIFAFFAACSLIS